MVNLKAILLVISFFLIFLPTIEMVFAGTLSWKLIGPGDADQVTSLSVIKDGDVFLGTDIGGLYHSNNQGEWWEPTNNGLKNYYITTPVIKAPNNPDVLYVGTKGGFYKSSSKGASWQNIRSGLPAVASHLFSGIIRSVAVDPFKSSNLYLSIEHQIYKSTDYGENWGVFATFTEKEIVYQIVLSEATPNVVYAAASDGIHLTEDGGVNWNIIYNKETFNIVLFPLQADKIVAAIGKTGVYITTDGGDNWAKKTTGLGLGSGETLPDYYSVLAADKENEDIIYVLNQTWGVDGGAYKTTNGGDNWSKITGSLPTSWLAESKRMNAIAIDPNNSSKIYLGSSRYIYGSNDGGSNWSQLISTSVGANWKHRGINVFGHTRFVQANPANSNVLFIGTTDHGVVRSDDYGMSWTSSVLGMKYKNSVWDIAFCKTNPDRAYAISLTNRPEYFNVSSSADGGKTWKPTSTVLDENNRLYKIFLSPQDCLTIFVCSSMGIFRSTDGGESWILLTNGLPQSITTRMAIDPLNPLIIYYAAGNLLFRSNDSGEHWIKLGTLETTISSIIISRKDPAVIFLGVKTSITGKGGIFKSIDSGKTWSRVLTASRIVSGIIQLTSTPEILYASTNDDNFHDESTGSGVFRSNDHGNSWTPVNDGLPVLRAFNINIDTSERVFLSSNGSGAYLLIDSDKKLSSPNNFRTQDFSPN